MVSLVSARGGSNFYIKTSSGKVNSLFSDVFVYSKNFV